MGSKRNKRKKRYYANPAQCCAWLRFRWAMGFKAGDAVVHVEFDDTTNQDIKNLAHVVAALPETVPAGLVPIIYDNMNGDENGGVFPIPAEDLILRFKPH